MDPVRIYMVGTAGSGKTTLTQAFKLWMDQQGLNAITVNLDPGADELPYTPDVDVRDWVSVVEVMKTQGLGPNGAQIACADIAAVQFPDITKVIEGFNADYILIDTPGQIELFAFREASSVFLGAFSAPRNIILYVLDPTVAKSPTGLVSLLMLSSSIQFRFDAPMDLILGKADLLEEDESRDILEMVNDPYRLLDALDKSEIDMRSVSAMEFMKAMENLGVQKVPKLVSSLEMYGIEDLYNSIQQYFSGGEDLRPD